MASQSVMGHSMLDEPASQDSRPADTVVEPHRSLEELTNELHRLLAAKQSSSLELRPPSGDGARGTAGLLTVNDRYPSNGETAELALVWSERLPGDLDFNGEVNQSDLQPLARYFGMSEAQFKAELPYEQHVRFYRLDSDGNGHIGLGDLRGIADHFWMQVIGYRAYKQLPDGSWQWIPGPGGSADPYSLRRHTVLMNMAAGETWGELVYRLPVGQLGPGEHVFRVEPCFGERAIPGDSYYATRVLLLDEQGYRPPNTVLDPLPENHTYWRKFTASEDIPFVFNFSAVAAEDSPVKLEFDFDGDAQYEETHTAQQGSPKLSLSYRLEPGFYPLVIRVSEAGRHCGYWYFQLVVRQLNRPPAVEIALDLGDMTVPVKPSLTDLTRDPDYDRYQTTYYLQRGSAAPEPYTSWNIWQPGQYKLIAAATDELGATANRAYDFTLLDSAQANPGWTVSVLPLTQPEQPDNFIAIGDRPAVSYSGRYIVAQDAAGAAWSAPQALPHGPETGKFTLDKLLAVNGRPAVISYSGYLSGTYSYAVAEDASGSAWNPFVTLGTGILAHDNRTQGLLMSNGRPALLLSNWVSGTPAGTHLIQANDEFGLSWPAEGQELDPAAVADYFGQIVVLGDRLAILSRIGHTTGSVVEPYVLLSMLDSPGLATQLQILLPAAESLWQATQDAVIFDMPDGIPVLLCRQYGMQPNTQQKLTLLRASDSTLSNWQIVSSAVIAGSAGSELRECSVATPAGSICVACFNPVSLDLSLLETVGGEDQSWREPIVIDNRGICTSRFAGINIIGGEPALVYRAETGPPEVAIPPAEWRIARRN